VLFLYNVLLSILLILGWPYILFKYAQNEDGWRERLGNHPRLNGKILWIHAASVGEVNAVSSLVHRLREECPQFALFITTFTRTGKMRARQVYGDEVFYAPLDFPFCVSKTLSRIRPEALILVESELWPNLITMTRGRGYPVFLVNGRVSLKTLSRHKAFNRLMAPVLSSFNHFMMQSEEHAERLKLLGANGGRISVIGNLKSDLREKHSSGRSVRVELGLEDSREVMVAGSTREGEEEMILEAFASLKDRMTLVLVPRHPERIAKIEEMMEDRGFAYWKRSEGNRHRGDVLLVDTIGELTSIYGAADIAFVGGSFLPYGGHNPLEAAVYGIPILFGPYMENAGGATLRACGGGIEVKDAVELRNAVHHLLLDPEQRVRKGILARRALEKVRGASEKAFSLIVNELDTHKTGPGTAA
jgi:3-deoxy-D-manno-octulosonic-acid transferase